MSLYIYKLINKKQNLKLTYRPFIIKNTLFQITNRIEILTQSNCIIRLIRIS